MLISVNSICSPRGTLMVGSPGEVAEKILFEQGLFQHQRFMAQITVGTMPHDKVMRAIELFGTLRSPPPCVRSSGAGSPRTPEGRQPPKANMWERRHRRWFLEDVPIAVHQVASNIESDFWVLESAPGPLYTQSCGRSAYCTKDSTLAVLATLTVT